MYRKGSGSAVSSSAKQEEFARYWQSCGSADRGLARHEKNTLSTAQTLLGLSEPYLQCQKMTVTTKALDALLEHSSNS